MKKVLFVCLGNICRSPAGESILRQIVEKEDKGHLFEVDSCGIGAWHIGEQAHPSMILAAKNRGYHLGGRAKQFKKSYFKEFDYILAAEKSVYEHLEALADTEEDLARLHMATDFSQPHKGTDVPDPYHGGEEHFEETLDILENICQEFYRNHLDRI